MLNRSSRNALTREVELIYLDGCKNDAGFQVEQRETSRVLRQDWQNVLRLRAGKCRVTLKNYVSTYENVLEIQQEVTRTTPGSSRACGGMVTYDIG